jgi:hypothetical protein
MPSEKLKIEIKKRKPEVSPRGDLEGAIILLKYAEIQEKLHGSIP